MSERWVRDDEATLVDALSGEGCARLALTEAGAKRLEKLYREAAKFFSLSHARKRRHMSADFNFGFRPFGRQYSVAPDRLDLNESFIYRADAPEKVPAHTAVSSYLNALSDYWKVVAAVADRILSETAHRLSAPRDVSFESASYIEINSYLQATERDLLQDRHEDGHLLTIVTANAPGLEVEIEKEMVPVQFAPGELLVMPGSLMSDLTGGMIRPLYHQVQNHGCADRLAILFLVNPADETLKPLLVNDVNCDVDLAERTRTNGRKFGLPDAPVI